MTAYLCIALVIVGLLMLAECYRGALFAGACAIALGFGYRLYAGEEIRAVIADALFVAALIPIGFLAAKEFEKITDAEASAAK